MLKIHKPMGEEKHYQCIRKVIVFNEVEYAKFGDLHIELTDDNTISDIF